jgi:hypothetical protein
VDALLFSMDIQSRNEALEESMLYEKKHILSTREMVKTGSLARIITVFYGGGGFVDLISLSTPNLKFRGRH